MLSNKQHTTVEKRTLNPVWAPENATFDFPIYLSLAEKLGVIELVIWDKDILRKDYLGEVAIPLEDWFRDDNAYPFDDPGNKVRSIFERVHVRSFNLAWQPFTFNVVSTRTSTHAKGTIQVKLGFIQPPDVAAPRDFRDIYADLVKMSRPSLVSAPPVCPCPCYLFHFWQSGAGFMRVSIAHFGCAARR